MKYGSYIKDALKSKKIVFYSLMGLFLFSLPYLLQAVFIYRTSEVVSGLLNLLLSFAGFLGGMVFLYIMTVEVYKNNNQDETTAVKPSLKVFMSFLGVSLVNLCIYEGVIKYILPFFNTLSLEVIINQIDVMWITLLTYGVLFLTALSLFIVTLIADIFIVMEGADIFKAFLAFRKALTFFLTNIKISFTLIVYGLLFTVLSAIIQKVGSLLIQKQSISEFLSLFSEIVLLVGTVGFFMIAITAAAFAVIIPKKDKVSAIFEKPGNSFSLAFIAILIVGGIFLNFFQKPSISDEFLRVIDSYYTMGEQLNYEDTLDLSAHYFKKSYAAAEAMKVYLKMLMADKDPSYLEEGKSKVYYEANQKFTDILKLSPSNGYIEYLSGLRYEKVEQNYNAEQSLKFSFYQIPEFPNPGLKLLKIYSKSKNTENIKEISRIIVKNRLFSEYTSIENKTLGQLKSLYDKFDKKAQRSLEKFPVLAMYYYENKMYSEAMEEIKFLQENMPAGYDNYAVDYLTAMIDLEMMRDGKTYETAVNSAEKIYKRFPNEKWAADFKAMVVAKAGNNQIAEQMLKESYSKNPDDLDIAEQYAYSLMKKNTSFTIAETDKNAEEIIDKILQKDSNRWFANYCKAVLALKKSDFAGSLDSLLKFSKLVVDDKDLLLYYDDFYYLYVLKYKVFMSNTEAVNALEAIKDKDSFAYDYIYGGYYWSKKDFENGKKYLEGAISMQPSLSKPYFLLGNVYFEHGYLQQISEDYPVAIAKYQKAISIFEEDPYAWFSLGHVYKKMNCLQEALGAFQKALYYMPAEDHNQDHFGVSIHSKLQIEDLNKKLKLDQ